jgi:hypothetical protein
MDKLPFFRVEFTKDGSAYDSVQVAAVKSAARAADVTDLIVMCHGWNNDKDEALELYQQFFGNLSPQLSRSPLFERHFIIAGVLWPSKRFAEGDLIPGGGAVAVGTTGVDGASFDVPSSAVRARLAKLRDSLEGGDSSPLDENERLIEELDRSSAAQKAFVDNVRRVLPKPLDTKEDASDRFFHEPGDQLLASLVAPLLLPATGGPNGGVLGLESGHAAGLSDVFSGIKAAAWRLLNYATYYQMKERAGVVGAGLNTLLAEVRDLRPDLRIHLIGHSFGARVVTAATDGRAAIRPASLSLLQGAFSHNGFTARFDGRSDGFFRNVVSMGKVAGPIVVTHTINDQAVGLAYPVASRISGDQRAALGDENDVFGGLGRNGAVKMGPTERVIGVLQPPGGRYQFADGKVYNLRADAYIANHGDVANPAVANAVCSAILR